MASNQASASPLGLLALSVLTSAVCAWVVVTVVAPNANAAADLADQDAPSRAQVLAIERQVEDMRDELRGVLDGLKASAAGTASVGPERTEVALDEAAVRRIVAEAMAADGASEARAAEAAAASPARSEEVGRILEFGVLDERSQAIWDQLADEDRLDEVVEAFAERAAANPSSPQAHADHGQALIASLLRSSNPLAQMTLSARADQAFDKALELDSEHWEARFSKAISYTHYPPVTGKPAQAIQHFETLIEQQSRRTPRPEYAQTYVALGNLHASRGETDKAREVWMNGARLYPDNGELRERLAR